MKVIAFWDLENHGWFTTDNPVLTTNNLYYARFYSLGIEQKFSLSTRFIPFTISVSEAPPPYDKERKIVLPLEVFNSPFSSTITGLGVNTHYATLSIDNFIYYKMLTLGE